MSPSHVWHDSFTSATWLIHTRDITVSWPIHTCDVKGTWQRPLTSIFPPFPYFFSDIKGGMTYMQTYIQMSIETFSHFPAFFFIFFSILFPDQSQGRHDNNARSYSVNQWPLLQWAYDYYHCCKYFFFIFWFFSRAYVRVADLPRLQRNKIEFREK